MALDDPSLDSLASLNEDGSRRRIHPAEVSGRVTNIRRVVFAILLTVLFVTPWVRINGRPAVLLDIPRRQFFLLGQAYNAQDTWLVFFLLTGMGFALLVTTTLFGRMWCGFACPQTVLVEGIYRRVETLFEGTRSARMKLDRAPWSLEKIARRGGKHLAFVGISLLIAHDFLGYFFPIRELWTVVSAGPSAHLEAFFWTAGIAALLYFDCGWFREQFCVIMCPYGRLQSMLVDKDTLVVGYDQKRGEPRGKLKVLNNGDCIDCHKCIYVCPTGIDIRQGLQLDCIGCGACVDACNDVMRKVNKPEGLIRLDSLRGFEGEKTKFFRPRTFVYAFAGLLGLMALGFSMRTRTPFEATLLRPQGAPFSVESSEVRNVLRLRLVSKLDAPSTLHLEPHIPEGASVIVPQPDVAMPALGSIEVPIIVTIPLSAYKGPVPVEVLVSHEGTQKSVTAPLLGPGRLATRLCLCLGAGRSLSTRAGSAPRCFLCALAGLKRRERGPPAQGSGRAERPSRQRCRAAHETALCGHACP